VASGNRFGIDSLANSAGTAEKDDVHGQAPFVKPTLAICNSYSDNRPTNGQALIQAIHESRPILTLLALFYQTGKATRFIA
jgi:hypothetical protein